MKKANTVAKPEHEIAYHDLISLLNRHSDKVSALEMLAITANALGKMIAAQDQRRCTPTEAMEIVIANIQIGNKQAIAALLNNTAGKA